MNKKRSKNRNPLSSSGWKIVVVSVMLLLSYETVENFSFWGIFSTASQQAVQNVETHSVPKPLANFHEAKKSARQLFRDHRKTFYCGCKFNQHNRIDLASCGYHIQQDKRRATRLEWEHIVPVSHLAANFDCWKKPICCAEKEKGKKRKGGQTLTAREVAANSESAMNSETDTNAEVKAETSAKTEKEEQCFRGRKCCQQADVQFSNMEADLHNLVPEVGELNALRSNYRFGELPDLKVGQFGQCEIKIDDETRRVEPNATVKGMIARTYLYMADTYHFQLSDSQRQLFSAWNAEYPPDTWEIEWDNRIFHIQGNHNLYISQYHDKL